MSTVVLPGTYLLMPGHCLEQMLSRDISVDDVRRVLDSYEQRYGGWSTYGEDRITYQWRDISVVVAPGRKVIVTVLYRQEGTWHSQDGRPSGAVLSASERRHLATLLARTRCAGLTLAA